MTSSLVSRNVLSEASVLSMPSPSCLSYAVLFQIVRLQFSSKLSPPSIDCSPLSCFLIVRSPCGVTWGPSIVFEAVDVPCPGRIPGPLHFSHIVDYVYDFCPPPLWSRCWPACPSMWCSVYFFQLCSLRQHVCSVLVWWVSRYLHHRWQITWVVHLSLQVDGKLFLKRSYRCLAYSAQHAIIIRCLCPVFSWGCIVAPFRRNIQHFLSSNYNRGSDIVYVSRVLDVTVTKIAGYVRVRILMNRWFFVFLGFIFFMLRRV